MRGVEGDTDRVGLAHVRRVVRVHAREEACPAGIRLGETSFQKWHEYVTVVMERDGKRVLSVVDGRTKDVVGAHFGAIPAESREAVEVGAMDMWRPSVDAAAKWLPIARVCFDRVPNPLVEWLGTSATR